MAELQISRIAQNSTCYTKAVDIDQKGNKNGIIDGWEVEVFNKALLETYFLERGESSTHGVKTGKMVQSCCGGSYEGVYSLKITEAELDKFLIYDKTTEDTLNDTKSNLDKRKKADETGASRIMPMVFGGGGILGGISTISSGCLLGGAITIGVGALVVAGALIIPRICRKKDLEKCELKIDMLLEKNDQVKEAEAKKMEEEAKSFASSSLMGEEVGYSIGQMMVKDGFKDLEVANIEEDINQLFMKKGNDNVEVKFTKTGDNTYAGMYSVSNGSKSELYIFKAEYIDTNKSRKLKLSKMRVVQDGVEDDSEVHKKFLKETVETSRTRESHSESENSNSSLGLGFFKLKLNSDSKMTSSDYREFERIITEQLPEGKEVVIYSLDK